MQDKENISPIRRDGTKNWERSCLGCCGSFLRSVFDVGTSVWGIYDCGFVVTDVDWCRVRSRRSARTGDSAECFANHIQFLDVTVRCPGNKPVSASVDKCLKSAGRQVSLLSRVSAGCRLVLFRV